MLTTLITEDEVLKMAEQCGLPEFENNESQAANLVMFAKLVADAVADKSASVEREACAKYVEGLTIGSTPLTVVMGAIGDAIRARGGEAT